MNNRLKIARRLLRLAAELAGEPAMESVVYSAILIEPADQSNILEGSIHPVKYGEHVTLYFHGDDDTYDTPCAGKRVRVTLLKHYADDHGEAWTVRCDDQDVLRVKNPQQRLHVTVSCNGVSPVYSNTLIRTGTPDGRAGFTVNGVIAYFMCDGTWYTGE